MKTLGKTDRQRVICRQTDKELFADRQTKLFADRQRLICRQTDNYLQTTDRQLFTDESELFTDNKKTHLLMDHHPEVFVNLVQITDVTFQLQNVLFALTNLGEVRFFLCKKR